jgi:hypothetical protein
MCLAFLRSFEDSDLNRRLVIAKYVNGKLVWERAVCGASPCKTAICDEQPRKPTSDTSSRLNDDQAKSIAPKNKNFGADKWWLRWQIIREKITLLLRYGSQVYDVGSLSCTVILKPVRSSCFTSQVETRGLFPMSQRDWRYSHWLC